jgi:hypothetical protein
MYIHVLLCLGMAIEWYLANMAFFYVDLKSRWPPPLVNPEVPHANNDLKIDFSGSIGNMTQ